MKARSRACGASLVALTDANAGASKEIRRWPPFW